MSLKGNLDAREIVENTFSEKSLFLREHPFAAKFSSSHLTLVASFDKLPALSLDENNFTTIFIKHRLKEIIIEMDF